MTEIAIIKLYTQRRGRPYLAISQESGTRRGGRATAKSLKDAVVDALVKFERAETWRQGDRGRPQGARDVVARLAKSPRS